MRIASTNISPEANVEMALSDADYLINRAQVLIMRGDDVRGVCSINACFYLLQSNLTTGTEFKLGEIPEPIIRPNGYVVIPAPQLVTASLYHNQSNVPFAGVQELAKCTYTISPNGGIFVRVDTVTTPATLGGSNYVIFPIVVSYTNIYPVAVSNL